MQLLSEELKAFEEERARQDLERGSLLFETLLQRKIVTEQSKSASLSSSLSSSSLKRSYFMATPLSRKSVTKGRDILKEQRTVVKSRQL